MLIDGDRFSKGAWTLSGYDTKVIASGYQHAKTYITDFQDSLPSY
jgi:hypothetical protein